MKNNILLARFDQVPSLICDEQQALFEAHIEHAASALGQIELSRGTDAPKMEDDFWPDPDSWLASYRPYNVADGVLSIPVMGVLMNGLSYQIGSYATGYDYIRKAFDRGMADSQVRGIALVIDSGGGEVAGNFDLVDHMFEMRDTKPIQAFAAEFAYSAAYSIASVAEKITVSRTGGVGSIGVVTMHIDMSQALEKAGIKVTFIKFGAHKTDGNRYEPLAKDVEARIQARIDELGEVFVSTVARNRGMGADAVKATEALTFTATQAMSNGLADAVGTLDDSVAAFAADLTNRRKGFNMADFTQAQYDEGVAAARAEGLSAGKAEGAKEGATAAVTRINGILASDVGKARPKAALSAALKTGMSVDEATAFLSDLGEEKAETTATDTTNATGKNFQEAMGANGKGVHDLGDGKSGSENGGGEPTPAEKAAARRAKVLANSALRKPAA